LKKILEGLEAGKYVAPEATAGSTQLNLWRDDRGRFPGDDGPFDHCKVLNDGKIDQDEDLNTLDYGCGGL